MLGVNLVKIWGNWCGPDWTGGQRVSAQDYQGSWNYPARDDLDRACRRHDRDCAHPDGCSRSADAALISTALRVAANPINRIFRPGKTTAAQVIAAGITAALPFRKR